MSLQLLNIFPAHAAVMCDEGYVYQECGDACPQTCYNIGYEKENMCSGLPCMEGCYCPEGMINHGRLKHKYKLSVLS